MDDSISSTRLVACALKKAIEHNPIPLA
ncbi:hypothetical protein GCK32_020998 [Trichostrongylus colubriformis]|uniref:Uncharacterized protein n=1 Tax=Trichostrongylus colubriformis TaxID=6319 RepID=A0AAN8ICR3_TRICO